MKRRKNMETDWAAMHEMQARLLQSGFLLERVRDWLALQDLFSKQLDETEVIFRPEREAYLKTLQERLQRVSAK